MDELGKIKLFNADCMDIMRQYPDKYFELAVVDPPYSDPNGDISGGKRFGGWFDKYKKDGDEKQVCRTGGGYAAKYGKKIIDWDIAPKQDYFDELFRVSKNQIIWGGNYFALPPTRCFVVWRKLTISENFSMAMAEYAWTSFRANAKVFECPPQGISEKRFHPTQKPVKLYEWLLHNYANKGDKILDTHLGSGSSAIAAHNGGFDFTGIELDTEYYNAAKKRIMERQRQLELFEP